MPPPSAQALMPSGTGSLARPVAAASMPRRVEGGGTGRQRVTPGNIGSRNDATGTMSSARTASISSWADPASSCSRSIGGPVVEPGIVPALAELRRHGPQHGARMAYGYLALVEKVSQLSLDLLAGRFAESGPPAEPYRSLPFTLPRLEFLPERIGAHLKSDRKRTTFYTQPI